MRKALAVCTASAAVVLGVASQPATAADTLVSLPVGLSSTTLSIAAPVAVVTPGEPAAATIATTVTDLRLTGTGWTVTIASTDLVLAGASTPGADGTIAASTMSAYTGDVEPTIPGVATIAGEYLVGSPLALSNTAQSFLSATGRNNINTAIYTATLNIPTTGKTQGIYTGTVTQSVS